MKNGVRYLPKSAEIFSASHTEIKWNPAFFHYHSTRELVFVDEGECEMITETGQYFAKGPFIMQYPEGTLHMQKNSPDHPYSRWLVNFDPAFLRTLFEGRLTDSFFIVELSASAALRYRTIFGLLRDAMDDEQTPALDERRRFLIASIYADLIPLIPKNRLEQPTEGRIQVFRICRYIDSHYAEKLTLDILSREFFIGRATIVREFRQVLDLTVGEYIRNVRVMKAQRMLLLGSSVAETAESCGFVSPSYFVQVFKSKVGMTPTAFLAAKCNHD